MSVLPVQDIFEALQDPGLCVLLAPSGGLVVSPGSRLTHELRDLIRGKKAALVDWLHAANDPDLAHEPPTNPNAWRELAAAHHLHHIKSSTWIAAGRGTQYGLRCGVGAALWNAYQNT